MRAKTTEGRRLRRLADHYAQATADLAFLGAANPLDHAAIRDRYRKAKEALYGEIDRLTSINLTPRAVSGS